jgi:hypothetical protein
MVDWKVVDLVDMSDVQWDDQQVELTVVQMGYSLVVLLVEWKATWMGYLKAVLWESKRARKKVDLSACS